VRVAIRAIGVTAASPLAARRLADALPAALERAFARLLAQAPDTLALRSSAADRIAAQVANTLAKRLRARP